MELSDIIQTARKRKKMTQATLAKELGVDNQSVSNWERGVHKPNLGQYDRIASALGFGSWEDLIASAASSPAQSRRAGYIPILAEIPASFDADGDVQDAYNYEDAIGEFPRIDVDDPRAFGLIVSGESMSPEYNEGDRIICTPKEWIDMGFEDGELYAIRFTDSSGNGTTFKRVRIVDDDTLELVPINPDAPVRRVDQKDVALAAIVDGVYRKRKRVRDK